MLVGHFMVALVKFGFLGRKYVFFLTTKGSECQNFRRAGKKRTRPPVAERPVPCSPPRSDSLQGPRCSEK